MSLPQVVPRDEWLVARKELLAKEKEQTRRRDALNAERRRLPMVEIEKEYVFEGPDGQATLLDLFDGRRQLMVRHFMFDPSWDDGCPSCSAGADELSTGLLEHLHARDTTLAYVSRAPQENIQRLKADMGWEMPWYTLTDDFDADFGVDEWHGTNAFLRDGDQVFHTYSMYARGAESLGGSYYFLDLTARGRQEDWEEPKGRATDARAAIPDFSA